MVARARDALAFLAHAVAKSGPLLRASWVRRRGAGEEQARGVSLSMDYARSMLTLRRVRWAGDDLARAQPSGDR
eukprot:SAG31_NODE_5637_length_2411_cov_2.066609_2_plen_74_part_00